jgi:hypothetical protein
LGRFREFSGPIFPFFVVFSIPGDGILAPRMGPCTIGHRKRVLKPRNWAPKLTVFYFVYLGIKPLVSLAPMVFEYSQDMLMTLVGPTHGTHPSTSEGGGLDTLFPSFFTLFWVAKSLNSPPQAWTNHMKLHVSNGLTVLAAVGCTLKWLCRT